MAVVTCFPTSCFKEDLETGVAAAGDISLERA